MINLTRSLLVLTLMPQWLLAHAQIEGRIFETGQKADFGNFRKCEFLLECDCCSGKLLFMNANDFVYVSYCTSDMVITKGTYSEEDESLQLTSDGSRIDIKYNWEAEFDPTVTPRFHVLRSETERYELEFVIEDCEGMVLMNTEKSSAALVAKETTLDLAEIDQQLRARGIDLKELISGR